MSELDLKKVEAFLYHEASFLDNPDLDAWMDLFTDDGTYWMPVNAGEPYYFVVRYYKPDLDNIPPKPCN